MSAALLITHAVYNLHPRVVKFKETITIDSLVGDYFCPNALRHSTTMKFRPCIDIHQGKVKQIVGSTLTDVGVTSNFESSFDSSHYARLFQENRLSGGHIIQLDQSDSTLSAAKLACETYAGGMQVGGGIQPSNARRYLEYGASHVIVTSFIFPEGNISMERLQQLADEVGKRSVVIDLSCARDEVT